MSFNVLIVDNDAASRTLIRNTLAKLGDYNFFEAANGHEAIHVARSRHIDLIICEWDLPIISGLVMHERLKALRFNIPLILVSKRNQRRDVLQAIEAGVAYYVLKPLRPEIIGRAIGEVTPTLQANHDLFFRVA